MRKLIVVAMLVCASVASATFLGIYEPGDKLYLRTASNDTLGKADFEAVKYRVYYEDSLVVADTGWMDAHVDSCFWYQEITAGTGEGSYFAELTAYNISATNETTLFAGLNTWQVNDFIAQIETVYAGTTPAEELAALVEDTMAAHAATYKADVTNVTVGTNNDKTGYALTAAERGHIEDSIHYAQRIQAALLPSLELFSDEIEHFVLYKPRDIVSGDFYWVSKIDHMQMVIAADCTGHGVPGAFMSMLGISMLNEIIINKRIIQPDQVLNHLRENIIHSLKQLAGGSDVKDGMDMSVCLLDFSNNKLHFAGANNPLWLISDGELNEIKGDKMPVAIHENMNPFKINTLSLKKGDTFYIFSDGYADQFGGPNQKKLLSKNFKTILHEVQKLPMLEQGSKIDEFFESWRRDLEQIDDVCVIGIRY